MGIKVILDKGPSYTGIKNLIPGHVYANVKGEEVLFVGYCHLKWDIPNCERITTGFVYMNVKQIKRKIANGTLTADLKSNTGNVNAETLFQVNERPRTLVRDLGEWFPSDYFEDFTMTDCSPLGYTYAFKVWAAFGTITGKVKCFKV